MSERDIYEQGMRDYLNGVSQANNPYKRQGQRPGDYPFDTWLAGWSGGYLGGDSWKMNSGITKVEEGEHHYDFIGSSGSVYRCHKEAYCLRMNNAHIWAQLQELHGDKVEMMDEKTNWHEVDWIIDKNL